MCHSLLATANKSTKQVSRFVFEFNAADKVSHLGNTYTWYGVNGVQYTNASHVMRR